MFESEQTAEADPNDAVATDFVYDEAGRLIKVILPEVPDPANGDTLTNPQYDYEYDIYGNLVKITDPNLRQTTFTYNELHKQTSRTLAGGPAEYKDYDEYGRLILAEDFAGRITTFEYNGRGQLGAKRYYPSWNYYENYPDDPCSVVYYDYDNLGRKSSVILDGEQWQYWYDIEGRVAKIKAPQGWIVYEYYDTGRKKSVSSFAANLSYEDITEGNEDSRVEYTYDELCRLYNVKLVKVNGQTVWPEDVTMYGYDEAGVLDWVCLPNGNCADYEYDQLNRLISLENRNSLDQVLTKFEYGLLDNGMRTSVVETFGQEETTLQWSYDNLGRLLGELCYETADPCNVVYQDSYVYDLVSNRIRKTADETTMYYHYNENDQLLAESSDEEGLNVLLSYLYDDNGSLVKKVYGYDSEDDPNDSYEYDFRNKLMRFVSSDGDVIGYGYDPDGIRVEKESGGTATEYLIDPDNLTGYSQIFSESDGVDTLTYIIGLDVLAQVAGSTHQYFEYGGHGSVRRLTDESGAVIGSPDNEQIYHYDAYGNAVQLPQNPLTSLRYVGEFYNPLPGFYSLRARDYTPATGRFTTYDPFEGNLQDPMSLHRYSYCYGNPINNIDPTGEFVSFTYVGQIITRSIESTLRSINSVYVTTVAPRIYFNFYRAFMLYQWALYQMPRIYLALGAIDISLTILDNMATTWLNNTQTIPAGNFDRGMMLHNMTGANLGRTFRTIDHFQNGVAVSIKTHSLSTQSRFFTAIRTDLNSLVGIENVRLLGRTAAGLPITIREGQIHTKCLLVGIPQTQSHWLFMESFRNMIRQLQTQYRTTIKVVPVKGWKK